jgi:hypothetical protein
MKIDFFKEKYFDLIIINNKGIRYFKMEKENRKITVLKSDQINIDIYSQGIFSLSNLEIALQTLLNKHQLTELGIILNLPNIIFKRISLNRNATTKEAIWNYLKINLPLQIEKYSLFYKEDKYKTSPTMATFDVFLISKEIIDSLLGIIEKYNLLPIFIAPSVDIIFQYLLDKTIIDVDGEYLIFLLEENNLIVLLIRKMRVIKVILEEYDNQKTDLNFLITRIYDFLKNELKETAKIIFFMDKNQNFSQITQQKIFLSVPATNIFIEGCYITLSKILNEKQTINFLPFKNYTAYFLNRLPSIIIFLSAYIAILFLLTSTTFIVFNNILKKEIVRLNDELKILQTQSLKEQLLYELINFKKITDKINEETLNKFHSLEKIKQLSGFESFYFDNQSINFSLQIDSLNNELVKNQIQQNIPQAKLIEENILENKVVLKYSL